MPLVTNLDDHQIMMYQYTASYINSIFNIAQSGHGVIPKQLCLFSIESNIVCGGIWQKHNFLEMSLFSIFNMTDNEDQYSNRQFWLLEQIWNQKFFFKLV